MQSINDVQTDYGLLSLDVVSSPEQLAKDGMIKPPTPDFIKSLKTDGQLDAILVVETKSESGTWYRVLSGSRRVQGLRKLTKDGEHNNTVWARIVRGDWDTNTDRIQIVTNVAREANEISDYLAIKRIMEKEHIYEMSEIYQYLGGVMNVMEISRLVKKFDAIPQELLNGIQFGLLTLKNASKITYQKKAVMDAFVKKIADAVADITEIQHDKNLTINEIEATVLDIVKENRITAKTLKEIKRDAVEAALRSNAFSFVTEIAVVKPTWYIIKKEPVEVLELEEGESTGSLEVRAKNMADRMTVENGITYIAVRK